MQGHKDHPLIVWPVVGHLQARVDASHYNEEVVVPARIQLAHLNIVPPLGMNVVPINYTEVDYEEPSGINQEWYLRGSFFPCFLNPVDLMATLLKLLPTSLLSSLLLILTLVVNVFCLLLLGSHQ